MSPGQRRRRWFRRYNRALQALSPWIFRDVLTTPPVEADRSSPVVLYTVLHGHGVRPYLLAVKSFLRFCPGLDVVVQSDGTLDDASVETLRRHVIDVRIIGRGETDAFLRDWLEDVSLGVDLPACRFTVQLKLVNVIARFPRRRLILFDSDLLFLRRPDAVGAWIESAVGAPAMFYGCGGAVPSVAVAFHAMGFEFPRVDVTRFNSGFAGFENVFTREDLVPLFRRVVAYDPALLTVWTIEQSMWTVLLNRFDRVLELDRLAEGYHGGPWDSYRRLARRAVYAHFVGSDRFRNFSYPRLGWRVIRELRRQQPAVAPAAPRRGGVADGRLGSTG